MDLSSSRHHVAAGTHADRIPRRVPCIPHREAVVMLADGPGKLCAGLPEEVGPLIRVEALGPEHRDEVLVAEFRRRPICPNVVLVLRRALAVHVVRVPRDVGPVGRDRIYAPMGVDAEFGVAEPLWGLVSPERIPGRKECWLHLSSGKRCFGPLVPGWGGTDHSPSITGVALHTRCLVAVRAAR